MLHTERKSLYGEVPTELITYLENPLSGRTLELMSYLEDAGPSDLANLVTYHACTIAEQEKGFDLFNRHTVLQLLRLQEFLLSWQNDITYDQLHLKIESAKTGLAEDE